MAILLIGGLHATAAALCFPDNDGDGYGDAFASGVPEYDGCPSGYVSNNLDCDDTDPEINLGDCISCPIALTGDVNADGSVTSSDIIYLIGSVFRGFAPPQPCWAVADIDCSGHVGSADIIGLVGYIFKGNTPPCDVCTLIPGTWSCP